MGIWVMSRTRTNRGLSTKPASGSVPAAAPAEALRDLDTQLMLQVQAGSAEAANALIRRNFERVSRYIARIVRHPRYVEDLTQDVFLQVLKHAPRYEPAARFSTWLYRIATNTALNYLNQAYVRKQRDARGELPEPQIPDRVAAPPEQRISLDELRERIAGAISSLPVNQRVALTLFQYEELSYGQIAVVLETTVESVRCLLKRARDGLRAQLRGLI
jgi:RNA polymerase sigma-70 factor (ECF subfamily)